jgi:hypothetical protein
MRRAALPLLGLACPLVLLLVCFRAVLFRDEQFAYRDSTYFYYPLYQRVQQEWDAGRVPLWEPGLNGGTPLLGYPMAAVLYPGKVLYGLLPYAWGARAYVVAHTALAMLGAVALGRALGVGRAGSLLGGLSYAFGAPVLSQYCNVIFLVGAAWVPWGLRALDRLLRQGRRAGAAELAVVLAMQVLGGDPESAYLTALCGAGYAVVLALEARGRPLPRPSWPWLFGAVVAWVAATLALAYARPGTGWFSAVRWLVLASWAGAGVVVAWTWRRRPGEARLGPMLAGLAGSCALAAALAAAQLLPVLEFSSRTTRVAEDSAMNIYHFSLEPYRLVELAWPNPFGMNAPENRSWIQAIPPAGDRERWVDSLYMGGLALVLALGAAGWRGVPSWRGWMTAVAVVALAASFGKYAGPLWWTRWEPLAAALGPHDPLRHEPREDEFLADGTGSPYGLLATLLPGFDVFRYPGKLLTFASVALATLAGAGWDRLAAGETARMRRLARIGLVASLVGLAIALAVRGRAVPFLAGRIPIDPTFGPSDVAGAWTETQRSLAHGAIVFAACLALASGASRRPRLMGALALVLMTADLAAANARLIWSVPQADFEAPSEVARRIEAAERADPSPGPFRVHRMPDWWPARFLLGRSRWRLREDLDWGRGTLQPLHALPLGLEYCASQGILELDDYVFFFHPDTMPLPAAMARVLGLPEGREVRYFPRRGFDLWGARYFVLPALPHDWTSKSRGYASFLDETDLIYPDADVLSGKTVEAGREAWSVRQDWQLRRNRAAYPRAWVVHYARVVPPADDPDDRAELMRSLIFMDDPIWSDHDRPVFDLRSAAWVEADDRAGLRGVLGRRPVEPSEAVTVVEYGPQRVELRATLKSPGLVILADTYYPGWRLTIDGKPATIYRTNRLMRGAAVSAGTHTLVYTYEPRSFRVGAVVSGAGLIALLALAGSALRGSRHVPAAKGEWRAWDEPDDQPGEAP